MKLITKTMMVLLLLGLMNGLVLVNEFELIRPGYASAAVPAPRPSQKKVIIKNLHMV